VYGLDPTGIPKAHSKGWLLFASYLSGTFGAAFMLLLAWNASNLAGHSKKVTVNALTLVSFCVGNILGTQTFQSSEKPGYKSGKIAIIGCLTAQIFVCVALRVCNDRLNKKNREILAGMSEEEKALLREKLAYAGMYLLTSTGHELTMLQMRRIGRTPSLCTPTDRLIADLRSSPPGGVIPHSQLIS
jgi:ACS family allantoate permease-like MFS transporter